MLYTTSANGGKGFTASVLSHPVLTYMGEYSFEAYLVRDVVVEVFAVLFYPAFSAPSVVVLTFVSVFAVSPVLGSILRPIALRLRSWYVPRLQPDRGTSKVN